jgi:UPF0271 protein
MVVDLNADLGEGCPNDEALLKLVTSANIACGFHAGDSDLMRQSVRWAIKYGVAIGAHPSFPDRENFGRTPMNLPTETVYGQMLYQLGALDAIVRAEGGKMVHVKPHGMLYNQAALDADLAGAIVRAVKDFNPDLRLVGLADSQLTRCAEACGLTARHEVFADRHYQADGTLVPRSRPDALIDSSEEALAQTLDMVLRHQVQAVSGEWVTVRADTVCLHGDGNHALDFARLLKQQLEAKDVAVNAF